MFSEQVDVWIVFGSLVALAALGVFFAGRWLFTVSRRRKTEAGAKLEMKEEILADREVIQEILNKRNPKSLDELQVLIGAQLDGRTAYEYFDAVSDFASEFKAYAKTLAGLDQSLLKPKWQRLSAGECEQIAAKFATLCDETERTDERLAELQRTAKAQRMPFTKEVLEQYLGEVNVVLTFQRAMLSRSQVVDPLTIAHLHEHEVIKAIAAAVAKFDKGEYRAARECLDSDVMPLLEQLGRSVFELDAVRRNLWAELQSVRDRFDEAAWIMSMPSDLNYARAERRLASLRKQFEKWAQYAYLLNPQDRGRQLESYVQKIECTYGVRAFRPLVSELAHRKPTQNPRVSTQIADFANV